MSEAELAAAAAQLALAGEPLTLTTLPRDAAAASRCHASLAPAVVEESAAAVTSGSGGGSGALI